MGENGEITLFCYDLDEMPVSSYIAEMINSIYIKVSYTVGDEWNSVDLEPVRISHDNIYELPDNPPPFFVKFQMGWYGYSVKGHFSDFPPNVVQVRPTYSWDGAEGTYQYIGGDDPIRWGLGLLGSDEEDALENLENQTVAVSYEEPLKSFLACEKDSFYLRMEITTEAGEMYHSQAVELSRAKIQMPLELTPRASLAFDLVDFSSMPPADGSEEDEDYYDLSLIHI